MPFHAAGNAAVRLLLRFADELRPDEQAHEDDQQDHHDDPATPRRGGKLPAEQDHEDDAELGDEIGRGELEGHGGGEIAALAKDRAGDRHRGVGAGG